MTQEDALECVWEVVRVCLCFRLGDGVLKADVFKLPVPAGGGGRGEMY